MGRRGSEGGARNSGYGAETNRNATSDPCETGGGEPHPLDDKELLAAVAQKARRAVVVLQPRKGGGHISAQRWLPIEAQEGPPLVVVRWLTPAQASGKKRGWRYDVLEQVSSFNAVDAGRLLDHHAIPQGAGEQGLEWQCHGRRSPDSTWWVAICLLYTLLTTADEKAPHKLFCGDDHGLLCRQLARLSVESVEDALREFERSLRDPSVSCWPAAEELDCEVRRARAMPDEQQRGWLSGVKGAAYEVAIAMVVRSLRFWDDSPIEAVIMTGVPDSVRNVLSSPVPEDLPQVVRQRVEEDVGVDLVVVSEANPLSPKRKLTYFQVKFRANQLATVKDSDFMAHSLLDMLELRGEGGGLADPNYEVNGIVWATNCLRKPPLFDTESAPPSAKRLQQRRMLQALTGWDLQQTPMGAARDELLFLLMKASALDAREREPMQLHPLQQKAVDAFKEWVQVHPRLQMLAPPGYGKSVTALHLFLSSVDLGRAKRRTVCIFTPRIMLTSQVTCS